MKDQYTVFMCGKGNAPTTLIKLEIRTDCFDKLKLQAKESSQTPKKLMENLLQNWANRDFES